MSLNNISGFFSLIIFASDLEKERKKRKKERKKKQKGRRKERKKEIRYIFNWLVAIGSYGMFFGL